MSPEREYTHGHQGREKVLCAPNRQIEATARRHRAPAGITVPRQTSGGTRGRGGGGRGPAHAAAGDGSTEGPQNPKPEPPCGPAGSSGYRAKEPDQDLRDTSPPTPRAAPPWPPRAGANSSSIPRRAGERNPASDATEGGSASNEEGNATALDDPGEPGRVALSPSQGTNAAWSPAPPPHRPRPRARACGGRCLADGLSSLRSRARGARLRGTCVGTAPSVSTHAGQRAAVGAARSPGEGEAPRVMRGVGEGRPVRSTGSTPGWWLKEQRRLP